MLPHNTHRVYFSVLSIFLPGGQFFEVPKLLCGIGESIYFIFKYDKISLKKKSLVIIVNRMKLNFFSGFLFKA